jgi:lipopolysaccharide export system protein LptA
MGKTDGALYILKKIIYLLITLFILGGTTAVCDELGALKVYKARLPIYNKKRLQYMIFCEVMTRKANKIYAEDAIIDLVKNNVDVNNIVYLEGVKPYKLGTSTAKITEFWKDKPNTLGFIASSQATILQESKVTSGNKKVFFRSPQLDLNGIGFTANFGTRIIKVLQDVDIIVRMKSDKKSKTLSEGNIVKVKADSMIMDMEKKLITLIGNVKVDDAGFDIFCSRLILDLNKKDKNDDKKESDSSINPSGISSITCLGKVKIIRKISAEELKKNGAQKAFADKAVYKTSNEQITLTGENPKIYQGDNMISGQKIIIWKNSERLQAFKNCLVETIDKKAAKPKKTVLTSNFIDFDYANNLGIFTGNVRVKNAMYKLNCNKMTVHLQTRDKKKTTGSGKKEIKKIICTGSVIVNDPRAQVNSDRMVVTFRNVPANKKSNADLDGGGKREVDLIKCFGNVNMRNKPENVEDKPTIINSNDAVLNIPGNVADLIGNVKIEESRFYLTCEKMKLLAKEITPEKAVANIAENQENPDTTPKHIGIGNTRELIKIICLEKVVMTRKLSYELQKATGDKGVYIINDHKIILTSKRGKPTLQRGPTIMEGTKIILWTDSEQLDVEDGTLKGFVGN